MKRRITIFGLVWVFAFNALWIPGGIDENYIFSACFPAWALFFLGLAIGCIHEMLSVRWLRILVSTATIATLTQLCLAMFGGQTDGFYLALPMGIATIIASIAAAIPRLTQLRPVPYLGYALLGMSLCGLLSTIVSMCKWNSTILKEVVSPNGIYVAQVRETIGMKGIPPPSIVIGPRHDPTHLFWSGSGYASNAVWSGSNILYIETPEHNGERGRYLNVRTIPKKIR